MIPTTGQNRIDTSKKRLLSVYDAGEYLSVSHWTVRELINKGSLPYVRIGRRLLVDVRELDRFIEGLKDRVL